MIETVFFRALAHVITGSQEDHYEIRLLITSCMSHHASKLSCYLRDKETMIGYLRRTQMEIPKVWATEVEIIAAAQ